MKCRHRPQFKLSLVSFGVEGAAHAPTSRFRVKCVKAFSQFYEEIPRVKAEIDIFQMA